MSINSHYQPSSTVKALFAGAMTKVKAEAAEAIAKVKAEAAEVIAKVKVEAVEKAREYTDTISRIKAEAEEKARAYTPAAGKGRPSTTIEALFSDAVAKQKAKSEAEAAEAIAKVKAEAQEQIARVKAEAEEKARTYTEMIAKVKAEAEEEVRVYTDTIARVKVEAEEAITRVKAEAVEVIARVKTETEAKPMVYADPVARAKTEAEQKTKAEDQEKSTKYSEELVVAKAEAVEIIANQRAKLEAQAAEAITRVKAEAEAADAMAKVKAETEKAIAKAEAEGKADIYAKSIEEAEAKAQAHAKLRAEAEEKLRAETEARLKAEEKAQAEVEKRARIKAELKAKTVARAEKIAKAKAKVEKRAHVETITRLIAEAADMVAKVKAETEEGIAKVKTETEDAIAKVRAEVEEETRVYTDTTAKVKAEEKVTMRNEGKEQPVPETIQRTTQSPAVLPDEHARKTSALCTKDIMQKELVWGSPDDSVQQAFAKVQQHDAGYMLVGRNGVLEGIVSRSDLTGAISPYLRPIFSKWRRPMDDATLQIRIKWIMSRPVHIISPQMPLGAIMRNMCRSRVRALPVADQQGKVLGLVTETNIFKAILKLKSDPNVPASDKVYQEQSASPQAPEHTRTQPIKTNQPSLVTA